MGRDESLDPESIDLRYVFSHFLPRNNPGKERKLVLSLEGPIFHRTILIIEKISCGGFVLLSWKCPTVL